MIQTEAYIFLAAKRQQINSHECLTSFISPFDAIDGKTNLLIADHNLRAGQTIDLANNEQTLLVFLPLLGAMGINAQTLIGPGDCFGMIPEEGKPLQVQNPYDDTAINFLQIHLGKAALTNHAKFFLMKFDLEKDAAELSCLYESEDQHFKIELGKFGGRMKRELQYSHPSHVLCFALHGAFEVQDRLIENRDSVLLLDTEFVEFESLASENLILVISYRDSD